MSNYGWIITKDYLEGDDFEETSFGVAGPRDIPDKMLDDLIDGNGEKFRLYDDDNELYYQGRIIGDFDGFEPLDDYGEGNAGCTMIAYYDDVTKEWVKI